MPNPLGIYEGIQDVTYLYGDYFVQAVVAATNEEDAIRCVFDQVQDHHWQWEQEGLEPPVIHPARVTARMIGNAVDVQPHEVFAIVYGHDDGL